jgi:hypothetical protein
VPSPAEADSAVAEAEARHRDPVALEAEVARWWEAS